MIRGVILVVVVVVVGGFGNGWFIFGVNLGLKGLNSWLLRYI